MVMPGNRFTFDKTILEFAKELNNPDLYALGKKIVNTFFTEEVKRKHELGPGILWLTRLSVIVLLIILVMDIASITAESYFNGMIKQNSVYWTSVLFWIIISISLWVSIISRWRNKGGV